MKEKQGTKVLVEALKTFYGFKRDIQLHKDFEAHNISNWSDENKQISERILLNVLNRVKKTNTIKLIKPIVEFYPTKILLAKGSKLPSEKLICEDLSKSNGIYVFYNSQGKALYVGKAKVQNLLKELKSAHKRGQSTYKVKHTSRTSKEKPQIKKHNVLLKSLAASFSAYEVDEHLIDNLEATAIRMFPNDLLNIKIEKIKTR